MSLGSRRETIRGRITSTTPSHRRFFGLIREPASFRVLFDDESRHAIDDKYGNGFCMPITQGFLWPNDATLPKVGTRLWVEYAIASPIESFFMRVPELATANSGFIEEESRVYGTEAPAAEPYLPYLLVQQSIAV
jgi:hypothetical protein